MKLGWQLPSGEYRKLHDSVVHSFTRDVRCPSGLRLLRSDFKTALIPQGQSGSLVLAHSNQMTCVCIMAQEKRVQLSIDFDRELQNLTNLAPLFTTAVY